MKHFLRVASAAVIGLALASWLVTGAHRGWTRTQVAIKTVDKVTGLDRIEWRNTFVPGFDFLGVAAVLATTLAGTSFLVPKKRIGNQH